MNRLIPIILAKGLVAPLFNKMPALILKIRYWKRFRRKINLKKPELFWDKIFYLSLYSDTSQWSVLADKFAVRDYVKKKCNKEILNEIYGVYTSPKDIPYCSLPDSFVLKTTNGCATNILVKQKSILDITKTNKLLSKWLKYPYAELTGQPHYARIEPRIIAEKFLEQDKKESSLIDYKIYCFNGVPTYINVLSNRKSNTHIFCKMMYDMKWNAHPEFFEKNIGLNYIDKPKSFDKMVEYAKILSVPFPYVRVDFYEIKEMPIFGEMTFTPGFSKIGFTIEFQKVLGRLIEIPQKSV